MPEETKSELERLRDMFADDLSQIAKINPPGCGMALVFRRQTDGSMVHLVYDTAKSLTEPIYVGYGSHDTVGILFSLLPAAVASLPLEPIANVIARAEKLTVPA